MSHKENTEKLDKDHQKRLDKLAEGWQEGKKTFWGEQLTATDLRLLLEHFPPLQDLIRAIAAAPKGESPTAFAHETTVLRDQAREAEAERENAEQKFMAIQARLEYSNKNASDLVTQLEECSAKAKSVWAEKTRLEDACKRLEQQKEQLSSTLKDCQQRLAIGGQVSSELSILRQDTELATQLGLEHLQADNTQALIQIVAVLAQRDSLERLWNILKERCESQNRAIFPQEQALLTAALTWYNYNWQSRPFQQIEVAPREAYNYEWHLRSRHAIAGECVAELRLPGIADGSGKPVCKALVSTQ
jgi:chromosome segregation ATPase